MYHRCSLLVFEVNPLVLKKFKIYQEILNLTKSNSRLGEDCWEFCQVRILLKLELTDSAEVMESAEAMESAEVMIQLKYVSADKYNRVFVFS